MAALSPLRASLTACFTRGSRAAKLKNTRFVKISPVVKAWASLHNNCLIQKAWLILYGDGFWQLAASASTYPKTLQIGWRRKL
jgi:hypothetical protein